jgi:F0F1-type ATP synthase gamma subunit
MNINLKSLNIKSSDMIVWSNLQELKQEMIKQLSGYMIYWAALQNKIWELASDMLLMKDMKNNANNTMKWLINSFNKIRQSLLTQEVSRIMSAKMFIES